MITYCDTRQECDKAITRYGGICLFESGQWLACHSHFDAERYRSPSYLDSLEKHNWIEPVNEQPQQALF